jgi:protein-serine/threonine kinase
MTQFFNKNASAQSERRVLSESSTNQPSRNGNSPSNFPAKVKNFFRINSAGNNASFAATEGGSSTPKSEGISTASKIRQSRFLSGIGRNRSVTVTSEGNALDDAVSPTVHANPYFAHQGPPALRHHNDNSVPPSPPDSPATPKINGANDHATTAGKEELARKLRRVASAPNAQGLFSSKNTDDRPQTADMGKEPLVTDDNATLAMVDDPHLLPIPNPNGIPTPGQIRQNAQFRRTYSSNSIKIRNVEVGPSSFDKIKLIGKGDVGKVYLVREKKSNRLYAMKGKSKCLAPEFH